LAKAGGAKPERFNGMNEIKVHAAMAEQKRGKRPSPWLKFGIEMGPLILFFFANARPKLFAPAVAPLLPPSILSGPNAGLFTATIVLMAAVAAALAVSFVSTRRLPAVPLMTAILALVFGGLTLYLQDDTFIKMKPTVLYAGFGAALFGGLAMNKPILPVILDNAMALTERGWRLLALRWGSFFFALALLNEIVWRTQSNDVWVAFKFPGMLILIFLFSMAQVPFILRHKLPDEEAERAPEHY
jgi:intracellular septation protein